MSSTGSRKAPIFVSPGRGGMPVPGERRQTEWRARCGGALRLVDAVLELRIETQARYSERSWLQ